MLYVLFGASCLFIIFIIIFTINLFFNSAEKKEIVETVSMPQEKKDTSIFDVGELYLLMERVKNEGEVKALSRLRVRILPHTLRERIFLSDVSKSTTCSEELLAIIKKEVEVVLGEK